MAAEAAWASWCLNLQPSPSSHGGLLTKILQLQHKSLESAPRPRDRQLGCLALGGNGLRVPAVAFDAVRGRESGTFHLNGEARKQEARQNYSRGWQCQGPPFSLTRCGWRGLRCGGEAGEMEKKRLHKQNKDISTLGNALNISKVKSN